MSDLSHDIEKYKRGEMTAAEMHRLEKKALSDPFLADALHGLNEVDHDEFTADINEFTRRISEGRKKRGFGMTLRIAAGVVIAAGAGILFYYASQSSTEKQTELTLAQPKPVAPVDSSKTEIDSTKNDGLLTLADPDQTTTQKSSSQKQRREQVKPLTNTAGPTQAGQEQQSLTEITTADATTQRETEEKLALEEKQDVTLGAEEDLKKQETLAAEEQKAEKAESFAFTPAQRDDAKAKEQSLSRSRTAAQPSLASGAITSASNHRRITGSVTAQEDGSPLPGVNVIVKGTTIGTITDAQGRYTIDLPIDADPDLVFSFIGLNSTEVSAEKKSQLDVTMSMDVAQLSEVVVVGYGEGNDDHSEPVIPTVLLAEPTGGRRAYKKYLDTSLRYPEQALESKVEGRVTIQFTVGVTGALEDFKVIKGIGYGCDNEVIRLIKEGPKWSPSRQGEIALESEVRVRMRFRLPN